MEKGVDLVIGHRQKHKGMSWRALGNTGIPINEVLQQDIIAMGHELGLKQYQFEFEKGEEYG